MSLIISFIHKPSQMLSLHNSMQLRLKVNPMSVLIATAIKSSILKQRATHQQSQLSQDAAKRIKHLILQKQNRQNRVLS